MKNRKKVNPVFEKRRKKSNDFSILKKILWKIEDNFKIWRVGKKVFSGNSSNVNCTPNSNKNIEVDLRKKWKNIFL